MSVPFWATRCTLIVVLASGCGRAVHSSEGDSNAEDQPAVLPSESALIGRWMWENLTAGAMQHRTVIDFGTAGTLRGHFHSMTSFTEPPSNTDVEGTFELGPNGTVRYTWANQGSRSEREHSMTFVEPSPRTATHPCCWLATRYWTHRGYLATNRARTRFHREAMSRTLSESGALTSFLRTSVDLTYPAAPAALLDRDDCVLDLAIRIEGIEGTRDFTTTLDCVVQNDRPGIGVVLFPGFDTTRDGVPLREAPSQAESLWPTLYGERSDVRAWPESLRRALARAFEPYLAFDAEHPDVLFHYVSMHTPEVGGYFRPLE
jgi:hypothetical protein